MSTSVVVEDADRELATAATMRARRVLFTRYDSRRAIDAVMSELASVQARLEETGRYRNLLEDVVFCMDLLHDARVLAVA